MTRNLRIAAPLSVVLTAYGAAPVAADVTPSPAPTVAASATPDSAAASPTASVENPSITAQVRAQYTAWQTGKVDRGLYSDEANKALTDAIVHQVSQQLTALGAPGKFTFVNQRATAGSTAYVYGVETPKAKLEMLLSLDAQQKINGIYFRPAR